MASSSPPSFANKGLMMASIFSSSIFSRKVPMKLVALSLNAYIASVDRRLVAPGLFVNGVALELGALLMNCTASGFEKTFPLVDTFPL